MLEIQLLPLIYHIKNIIIKYYTNIYKYLYNDTSLL